jgi:N-acetyl sugar amidotransferase
MGCLVFILIKFDYCRNMKKIKEVFWCSNCLNMSTRPRITFDENGWCNACQWVEEKKTLDWDKRETELINLLEKYRSETNDFDCVVPVSGGKDGSYIAYTLKEKYKMNPLCINVTPPLPLEIGETNVKNFAASGYNLIQLHLNPNVMRFLDKKGFTEMGFPYFGWLVAIQAAVIHTAIKFNLSLLFYGEDGEVEYGGSSETKNNSLISIEYQKRIWFESGYDNILDQLPLNIKKDAVLWKFPPQEELDNKNLYTTTWSYFENWDPYRNYMIAKDHCGLMEAPVGNSGTFTNFAQTDQSLYALHMYLCYLKFGFGRALQDAGIEIRRGAMTRDQAINLVKLYDGQFPEDSVEKYLDYYQMKRAEFDETIDKWANTQLFEKVQGSWKPKFEII